MTCLVTVTKKWSFALKISSFFAQSLIQDRVHTDMEGYYEPLTEQYHLQRFSEASTGSVLQKTVFLEVSQNSQDDSQGNSQEKWRSQPCNFIKKETLAQVFFCEF